MSVAHPRSRAQIAETLEKEANVLALRKDGLTYREIAEQVGYKTPSAAQKAWLRSIARTVLAPASTERERQVAMVNGLLEVWYPKALDGKSEQAVREVNRLMIRLARLTGADMPTTHRLIVTDQMTAEIEALAAELNVVDAPAPQMAAIEA